MAEEGKKIKAAISMGDMNGIGIEVIIKSFMDNRMFEFCTPIVYASASVANFHRKALDIGDFSFNIVANEEEANPKRVNLINCWKEELKIEFGQSNPEAGKYAVKSLKAATEALASNKADVLVTAPFNKHNVRSDDFPYAGHTEYLADYANEENPLMIMCSEGLRVGLVTGHVSLSQVPEAITQETILAKLDVFHRALVQDFAIRKPKIAVLGLNPHAGDQGLLGDEEEKIISPAIKKARDKNIFAIGPFSADGFFGTSEFAKYDGVLAMYHDQGLVAFKALSFETGVNYTAGLPIVRTSPDHGTAYNIAGKGMASEASFRNAALTACDIYKTRKEQRQLTVNPLEPSKVSDRDES